MFDISEIATPNLGHHIHTYPFFYLQNRTKCIKFGASQNTHTQTKREEIRGYLSTGRQELCAEYCSSKKKRLRDTFGPPSKHKIPITINKKKKPNFVRDQNLKVFIQMEWDLYVYIYTKNYQTEHSNQKRERSACET